MARRSGKTLAALREESGPPYSVFTIANYFIGRSLRGNDPIDHRELHRLVYLAYGYYLLLEEGQLFRERLKPTPRGPVVAELYHEFKRFGPHHLTQWSRDYDFKRNNFYIPLIPDSDHDTLMVLGYVWKGRATTPPTHHMEPCELARKDRKPYITDELIQEHFWEAAHV